MRLLKWLLPILVVGFLAYWGSQSWHNWISTEPKPRMALEPCSLQLAILNASEIEGAAWDVREYLTRQGFDVYEDRNSDEILPRTRLIDRLDTRMKYAREVQKFLTIPARKLGPFTIEKRRSPEVGSKVDSLLFLHVTVVLGADFRQFFPGLVLRPGQ